jgi:hypothetical protein
LITIQHGQTPSLLTWRKVQNVSSWPEPARQGGGQTTAALPGTCDVDFLGDLKRDGGRFGFEMGIARTSTRR